MRTTFLAILVIFAASLTVVRAANPAPAGQPADAEAARAGRVLAPNPFGPDADPSTHPWNPDVHHSDDWPYEKPLQVPTDFCGPPGSFWLTAEFLLWGLKGERLPPLLTAGPSGSGAVPGPAGVQTILGGNTVSAGSYYGGRFTAGVWIDNDYTWAFEGGYFFIADRAVKSYTAFAGQPGSPDLGRPYLNTATGLPASSLVASAGVSSGYLTLLAPTEFQGAEANFIWNYKRTHQYSVDFLGGFRYQDLGGDVTIASGTTALSGPTAGTGTTVFDQFSARNRFFGGQLGARAVYRWHQLVFTFTKKFAIGGNAEDINIVGYTTTAPPGGTATTTAVGFLTGPGNIGSHTHPTFSFVDEFDFKVGWQICDYVQAYVGYTIIMATAVARPAGLIDLGANPAGGNPVRPTFVVNDSAFWAQGLNVGLEIRY